MDDIERLVRASGRAGMGPVPIAKGAASSGHRWNDLLQRRWPLVAW